MCNPPLTCRYVSEDDDMFVSVCVSSATCVVIFIAGCSSLCFPHDSVLMKITMKCVFVFVLCVCYCSMSISLSWSSQSVSELSGLSPFLSPSHPLLPHLSLPMCVFAAVSVWGDAAGAPGHHTVSWQPAGEAPASGSDAAAAALTPGGASGTSSRREPQQREAVRGHRTPWTPLTQTGAGGRPGREGVQPHPHLPRVSTLPGTEDASARGHWGPSISHTQWGEHRVGQDHK